MSKICFLDLETTGLSSDLHEIWEIGLITRNYVTLEDGGQGSEDTEHLWRVKPDLSMADPNGLRIGRFYERTAKMERSFDRGEHYNIAPHAWSKSGEVGDAWSDPDALAAELARLLDGAHIVGAVPSFDAAFLARWLPAHGQAFTAHYHLIDVEAMVIGYLGGVAARAIDEARMRGEELPALDRSKLAPPWNSNDLSRALGVDPDAYERHTALGDARWVKAQYDAIHGAVVS